jgi:RNA polymerase sigma-70 factor, ECF subfamily
MNTVAGATTLGDVASVIGARANEASVVAELKAGSEEAYAWLIAQYHQPIYSLVFRILGDPADAADITQEVFIKVFRGMNRFNADSSLKTWIYRIALRESSNQRRWWSRHKAKEASIEPAEDDEQRDNGQAWGLKDTLIDEGDSPFDLTAQVELRDTVERELKQVQEPFRTTLILRDIEELSYEEIADVMDTTLGTVKSRLMRGRDALRKRLESLVVRQGNAHQASPAPKPGQEVEVTS